MRKIWAITKGTMKEAARRRSMAVTLIASLIFIVILGVWTQFLLRQADDAAALLQTFLTEGTIRTISFFGVLLTLFITMYTIPLEVERRTIYTLLSKPLERYQFILGKFFGCMILLGLNLLVMALIGFWMIVRLEPSYAAELVRSFGVLYVRLTPLCALLILFTTLMPSFGGAMFAAFMSLMLFWGGQLPGAFKQVAESEGASATWRFLARILYPVIVATTPRVNKLNFDAPIFESPDQMQAILSVLGYAAGCIVLSCIIFGRKEL